MCVPLFPTLSFSFFLFFAILQLRERVSARVFTLLLLSFRHASGLWLCLCLCLFMRACLSQRKFGAFVIVSLFRRCRCRCRCRRSVSLASASDSPPFAVLLTFSSHKESCKSEREGEMEHVDLYALSSSSLAISPDFSSPFRLLVFVFSFTFNVYLLLCFAPLSALRFIKEICQSGETTIATLTSGANKLVVRRRTCYGPLTTHYKEQQPPPTVDGKQKSCHKDRSLGLVSSRYFQWNSQERMQQSHKFYLYFFRFF